MNQPIPITDEQLREDMIAYLDGELASEQSRHIEQRLAADEAFARELRQLQQSYELLDELPQAEVDETFAATTVGMIAVEAGNDVALRRRGEPRRFLLQAILLIACLAGAIVGGYLLTGALLPDPNAQLLRDMSVLANLDEYQQVESIEFLRQLHASGLFADHPLAAEAVDSPQQQAVAASPPLLSNPGDLTVAERRARLQRATPAEKNDLSRSWQRFENLTPRERESLIELDRAIAASPDRDQLRQVLRRYYEWIKDLSVEERSELRMLAAEERLTMVDALVMRQRREASRSRIIDDFRKTVAWSEGYAQQHQREVAALLSEREQMGLRRIPERFRAKRLSMELWKDWYGEGEPSLPLQAEDWQPLVDQLSPPSRATLDGGQPPVEQWRSLLTYFSREIADTLPEEKRQDVDQMDRRDRIGLLMRFAMQPRWESPEVDGSQLRQMFSKLPQEERDRLLQLPPDEMGRQLRYRLYRQHAGERRPDHTAPPPPTDFRPHRGQRDDQWRGPRGDDRRGDDHRGSNRPDDRRGPPDSRRTDAANDPSAAGD